VQGGAAALASPSALALIALEFPGERARARAFAVWGAVAGAGGVGGLLLSGLLIDTGSWRWILLVNPPIVVVALVLVPKLAAESRSPSQAPLDIAGAVLGTTAITSMIYGLLGAADHGWGRPGSVAPLALAIVLAVVFVRVEQRSTNPLVPLQFLIFPPRLVAIIANSLFAGAFYSLSFLLMLHLQRVLGYSALEAAAAYLPHGAALLIGVATSSLAADRYGLRPTLITSMVLGAVGMVTLSLMADGNGYVVGLLPGVVITGLAAGLGFPLLAVAALIGADQENVGLGSALLSASQQLGGAVGLAVFVNIATASSDPGGGALATLADGISTALFAVGVVLVIGAVTASRLPRRTDAHAG
jgi:Na+/melibiose symporter-like transporter